MTSIDRKLTDACNRWLGRTYEIGRHWIDLAREQFIAALGDSNAARAAVGATLRDYFCSAECAPETIRTWSIPGHKQIVDKHVTPPTINAGNIDSIDWNYLADYLLLPCGPGGHARGIPSRIPLHKSIAFA